MAGISSEKALMDKLGVPTKIVQGAQWDAFAKEAQTGNPVTISTSGTGITTSPMRTTPRRVRFTWDSQARI